MCDPVRRWTDSDFFPGTGLHFEGLRFFFPHRSLRSFHNMFLMAVWEHYKPNRSRRHHERRKSYFSREHSAPFVISVLAINRDRVTIVLKCSSSMYVLSVRKKQSRSVQYFPGRVVWICEVRLAIVDGRPLKRPTTNSRRGYFAMTPWPDDLGVLIRTRPRVSTVRS